MINQSSKAKLLTLHVAAIALATMLLWLPRPGFAARHALLVANWDYPSDSAALGDLHGPKNDLAGLQALFAAPGAVFDTVQVASNVSSREQWIQTVLPRFLQRVKSGDEVFFYYSGHGGGYRGAIYLIPTGHRFYQSAELPNHAINPQVFINRVEDQVGDDGKLVMVFDACRNELPNQFKGGAGNAGFNDNLSSRIESLIVYPTGSGRLALDGAAGQRSLFTDELIASWQQSPTADLRVIVNRAKKPVRDRAYKRARHVQIPHVRDGLVDPFCLHNCAASLAPGVSQLTVKTVPENALVKIMNIPPKYQAGIQVAINNSYDIYVQAEGYKPYRAWHEVTDSQQVIAVVLNQLNRSLPISPVEPTLNQLLFEPEMIDIPGGRFQMGCLSNDDQCEDDEKPLRWVSVKPFRLAKTETTFAQYDAFAEATGRQKPHDHGWGRGKRPVIYVSWEDAQAYIAWLNKQTGRSFRLPSEAQWEYAARAGTTTPYYTGKQITATQANFNSDIGKTVEVAKYAPNAFGLHDMLGNVWEWVEDHWHASYNGAPNDDSAWISDSESRRVLRGGSWDFTPRYLRAANRSRPAASYRVDYVGFRLAEDLSRQ